MTYGTQPGGYPPTSKLPNWPITTCVLVTLSVPSAMVRVGEGLPQRTKPKVKRVESKRATKAGKRRG